MDILNNLDLFSVGVAISGTGILGFVVYFNNKESITNRSFLYFSIATILWGIVNYSSYQFSNEVVVLWLVRFTMFFAVFQAFFLYRLFHVFPNKQVKFREIHIHALIPIVIITAFVTITPYLFQDVAVSTISGGVPQVNKGPGIILFAIVSVGLVFRGLYLFIRRTLAANLTERKSFFLILFGTILMFGLIIAFNFILPAFFNRPEFVPLGAVFIIPFVAFTSYAILKHKLFDIKVVATATLVFVLSVVIFLEIIFSDTFVDILMESSVFALVLIFGIFLIKSVRKEVALREKIQELAKSLEKANTRLKELDRLKSEFVSFATHQIRAPLTAIKGYVSLIQEGSYGPVSEEVKGAIDKINQSSHSLVLVVEDYLNISRIEMGKMKYNFAIMDFGKLISEVAKELEPNFKKAGLELFVEIPDGEYKASIDEGKMRQVIVNIIDNAIKYTKKGSIKITLARNEKKNKLLLTVSDTGVGIGKDTMPKLFSKFIRAKNASEVNIHGTGLGLYIARQMAQAHRGGRLWAESEGEGKGSRFYVELDAEK